VLADPLVVSNALAFIDPLVIGDELVVGETLLVHSGALTLQLRLGSVPTRLLLGDPRSSLGDVSALCPAVGFFPMLRRGPIATLLELALTSTNTAALTAARDNESKGDHDQHYDNDDRDYYTS
jgi:hypothetical protein